MLVKLSNLYHSKHTFYISSWNRLKIPIFLLSRCNVLSFNDSTLMLKSYNHKERVLDQLNSNRISKILAFFATLDQKRMDNKCIIQKLTRYRANVTACVQNV